MEIGSIAYSIREDGHGNIWANFKGAIAYHQSSAWDIYYNDELGYGSKIEILSNGNIYFNDFDTGIKRFDSESNTIDLLYKEKTNSIHPRSNWVI
jgi:streptogramin lyase